MSFVWVVEALVYFVAALASGGFLIGSGTYCGGCKRWCDELNVTRLQRDETGALAARVNEAQDWSVLLRPAPADGEGEWHQVTIHQCPACKQTSTVTIHDVSVSHDAKRERGAPGEARGGPRLHPS